jgi:hypothetical protein
LTYSSKQSGSVATSKKFEAYNPPQITKIAGKKVQSPSNIKTTKVTKASKAVSHRSKEKEKDMRSSFEVKLSEHQNPNNITSTKTA